jgi:hypothetical protein
MGKAIDLQSILNDVSACIGKVAPVCHPVTELEAFTRFDPLLVRLHKEYLDAKAMRCKSEKDFGKMDSMTDMAMMVEDSAWCAMQTRYMEVRSDRRLMAQVQELMEDERQKASQKREQENREDALRYYRHFEMMERMRKKTASLLEAWWAMLALRTMGRDFRLYQPTHHFNRLAA